MFDGHWRKAWLVKHALATASEQPSASGRYSFLNRSITDALHLPSCRFLHSFARLEAPLAATVVSKRPSPSSAFYFFAAPSRFSKMPTSAILSTTRRITIDLADLQISPITAQLLLIRGEIPDDDDEEESDCDEEELDINTNRPPNSASANVRYTLKISGFSLDAPYSRELNQRVGEVSKELGQEKVGSDLAPRVVDDVIAAFSAFKHNFALPALSAEAHGLQVECVFAELNTPEATITRYENGYIEMQVADVTIDGDDIDTFLNSIRASLTSDLKESLASDVPDLGKNSENLAWKEASAAFISLQKTTKAREARERKVAKAGNAGKVQKVVKGAVKKHAGTTAKLLADKDVAVQRRAKSPQVGPNTKSLDDEKQAGSANDELWGELFGEKAPTPSDDDERMERELREMLERDDLADEADVDEEPLEEPRQASNAPNQIALPGSAQHNPLKRGADGETPDPETARPAKMAKAARSAARQQVSPKPTKMALPPKMPTGKAKVAPRASEHGVVPKPSTVLPASVTNNADQSSKNVEHRFNEKNEKIPWNKEIKFALRYKFDEITKTRIIAWCKIHGISTHGKKDDIQRRIDEFVTRFGDQLDPFYGRVPGAAEFEQASRARNPAALQKQRARFHGLAGPDQSAIPSPAQPATASWPPQTSANFAWNQRVAAGQVTSAPMEAQAPHSQFPAPQNHQAFGQQQGQVAGGAQIPSAAPQVAFQTHITPQRSTLPVAEVGKATPKASKVQAQVVQPGLPYPIYQKIGTNDWGFSGDKKSRTPSALEIIQHCNRFSFQPELYADFSTYNTAELRNFLRSVGCEDVRSATVKVHLDQLVRNWYMSYMKGNAGPIPDVDIEKQGDGAGPDAPADQETGEMQQQAAAVQNAPATGTMPLPAQSAPAAQPAAVQKAPVTGRASRPAPDGCLAQSAAVQQLSQVMQQDARRRVERGEYAPGDFSLISRASASGFARGVPPNRNFPAPAAGNLNRTNGGRIDSQRNRAQPSRVRANEQTLTQLQQFASENIIMIDDDEEQQPVAQEQPPIANALNSPLATRMSGDVSMNMAGPDRGASGRITKHARPQRPLSERDRAQYQAEQLQALANGQDSAPSFPLQSSNPLQPALTPPNGYHVPQGPVAPASMFLPQDDYKPQSPGIPPANLASQQDSPVQMSSTNVSGFVPPPPGYYAVQQPGQQHYGLFQNQHPGQPSFYSQQQGPSAPQYCYTPYEQYRQ
ncbi:hypothetical protein CERZMDRAFT_96598 [Cercospora zeae-maydis SCOH1-5]|uniref:SAP domain-containing protein n=1 Tax=Cercospora zeae-maydis SCOH1-5 TaxID=717836 RepID=A0A6A6FKF2_9PEZI|nr:hypothetical protein CERZMDRAFT_96598 [Cercospora zeae-maydis SCOH1-5]